MRIHKSDAKAVAQAHAKGDVGSWKDIMVLVQERAAERAERHQYCQKVMQERRVWAGLQDFS